MDLKENPKSEARNPKAASGAFTLIELLVVITVIAILIALLFPAFQSVQDQAKRTQSKNDLTQIVTAVNAFYTEYGKYPTTATTDAGAKFGPGGVANSALFNELRAVSNVLNTRLIVFVSPPDVKDPNNPRSGIARNTTTINGISVIPGDFVDPWGTPYSVAIDANYDNQVANAYTDGSAGGDPNATPAYALRIGVIAWSFGKDQTIGTKTPASSSYTNSDDVISWQ
ncbi:MAG: prepilin-type N-terminal cleavage/methylation domain-containing protein [Chthoniobacterales bacterium]|nr:prepilin-type N-terminal cleavage/methylation domain-containing protein [Chthoniobacterales bacterium]